MIVVIKTKGQWHIIEAKFAEINFCFAELFAHTLNKRLNLNFLNVHLMLLGAVWFAESRLDRGERQIQCI